MRRRLAGFIMPDVATGSSSAQLGDAPGGGNKLARPPGRYARKNAGLVCCMLLADTPVRNPPPPSRNSPNRKPKTRNWRNWREKQVRVRRCTATGGSNTCTLT